MGTVSCTQVRGDSECGVRSQAGGLQGRLEVGRHLGALGASCAVGAGSIGPRVRPAQRPRGGRAVTKLSALTRGSAGGAGEGLRDGLGAQGRGCLSAWEGWEHWERKQSGPLLRSGRWQPCTHGGGKH